MRFSFRLPILTAGAFALVLTGCDAADSDVPADEAALSVNEDAAVVVANALALDAGGALDAVAQAAAEADPSAARLPDPGCTFTRDFDAATFVWTTSATCERGDADGAYYAAYARERTFAFAADDRPVADPAGATSVDVELVSGTGIRRSPRFTHTLDDLSGAFTVTGLGDGDDLVTTNGLYSRSATDTVRHRGRTRTVTSTLDLVLDDLTGPSARRADWRQSVSGTISGTVQGEVAFDGPRGYSERTFDRAFTVTFGEDGGEQVARIAIGGDLFLADVETGTLRTLE
jgi:hypothetical protein